MKLYNINENLENISTITEMTDNDINIVLADGVDIEALKEGDDDPLFVIVEVIHECTSGNNNYYSRDDVKEFYNQILKSKPNAYKGHLDAQNAKVLATKSPNPHTIWIGAGLKEVNGKLTLFAKGYVMPYSKYKVILKKAYAVGKAVPVSVFYTANRIWDTINKRFNLKGIKLSSIDWAREGGQGVVSLTNKMQLGSEMTGSGNNKKDNKMDYNQITLDSLRENRPDLVQQLEDSSTLAEMATTLGVESEKVVEKIAEMQKQNSELSENIAEMRKSRVKQITENVITEKCRNDKIKPLVKSFIVAEMAEVDSVELSEKTDEEIKSFVAEMFTKDELVSLLKTQEGANVISPTQVDNSPRKSIFKRKENK